MASLDCLPDIFSPLQDSPVPPHPSYLQYLLVSSFPEYLPLALSSEQAPPHLSCVWATPSSPYCQLGCPFSSVKCGPPSRHSTKSAFFEFLSKVQILNPMASSWTTCFSVSLNTAHTVNHHFFLIRWLLGVYSLLILPLSSLIFSQCPIIAPNLPPSSVRYTPLKYLPLLFFPLSHLLAQQVHKLLIH